MGKILWAWSFVILHVSTFMCANGNKGNEKKEECILCEDVLNVSHWNKEDKNIIVILTWYLFAFCSEHQDKEHEFHMAV